MKLDHVGIAIKNIENSKKLYNSLLNSTPLKEEFVESEQVNVVFYKTGDAKIELLSSENEHSAITKFIEKKGEGIHHIAFEVEDIESEIKRLVNEGFQPLSTAPKKGANNKLVFFFHPKSTGGTLIEICQEIR